jgi:hypothetical protein
MRWRRKAWPVPDGTVEIYQADCARLIRLIRWMALPYAGGGPIWSEIDDDGRPIGSNRELDETWRLLFGEPTCEFAGCDRPATNLKWRRCKKH